MKSEIFLWFIFDFELQTDVKQTKETKDWKENIKAQLLSWQPSSPNKRLTYGKIFVRPLVDYQLQIISKTLDDLRWGPNLQKSISKHR